MNNRKKALVSAFLIWTNLIEMGLYLKHKEIVDEDMCRYIKYTPFKKVGFLALNYLELFNKPWRSVFNYRCARCGVSRLLKPLIKRSIDSIELYGNIPGGLLLLHKQGCIVLANKVGKNLTVSQGVTIGKGHANSEGRDIPNIGDNVWICPNSIIFGGWISETMSLLGQEQSFLTQYLIIVQ